ncbi:MAG: class I SAM-dependent methyltransferase [Candidatus Hodarchaeota archaeon]
MNENQTPQEEQNIVDETTAVPFTARLMAYYRAKENEKKTPLIVDPFAARLAGDITAYIDKHRHFADSDYPLVRSYYIEKNLLAPWCNLQIESQIVLLGAGLDTRVYRFQPLQTNTHTIFEIDFAAVNRYKEELLGDEPALCNLVRLSTDLSNLDWTSHLIKSGFSSGIPTFWVLEGLAYYLELDVVSALLKKAVELSAEGSQIFVDICVPGLAELDFGPFARHFKWGLEMQAVPSFFAAIGWNVSCSFADNHDQGRDVGQRGLIFIHGMIKEDTEDSNAEYIHGVINADNKDAEIDIVMTKTELQAFAAEIAKKIIPEVEKIVETYKKDPEEGLFAYIAFIKRVKPSLEKIANGLRDRTSLGLISPRLLRDPLSIGLIAHRRPLEEEEAHIVGYLQAILLLVWATSKGLEGWEFLGTALHKESLKTQNVGKIDIISSLVQTMRREICEVRN